ncbi:hypothetical protein B0H14DRAFT_2629670 [Mycena olivaceomarginata]|nr:hypothetical protein B0H14DRAFT_2629670 [Mycena olivaceomarginata]
MKKAFIQTPPLLTTTVRWGWAGTENGYDPLFPNMPPLPPTSLSSMDYLGWDMGMGMGMGSDYGRTAYGSTMMPVLNMPPSSPTAAEKREREKGGEGDIQPAQKRRRKENTATTTATRGTARCTWRQRSGGEGIYRKVFTKHPYCLEYYCENIVYLLFRARSRRLNFSKNFRIFLSELCLKAAPLSRPLMAVDGAVLTLDGAPSVMAEDGRDEQIKRYIPRSCARAFDFDATGINGVSSAMQLLDYFPACSTRFNSLGCYVFGIAH